MFCFAEREYLRRSQRYEIFMNWHGSTCVNTLSDTAASESGTSCAGYGDQKKSGRRDARCGNPLNDSALRGSGRQKWNPTPTEKTLACSL